MAFFCATFSICSFESLPRLMSSLRTVWSSVTCCTRPLRIFVDLGARTLHGVFEQGHDILGGYLGGAGRSGQIVGDEVLLALELLVHRAHRNGARHFPGRVAPHAVG